MVMVRPREINETPVGTSYANFGNGHLVIQLVIAMYRVNANLNANDAQNSLSDNKVQLRRGSTMILTPYAVAFTRAKLGYVVVGPGDKVDCKTEPFSSLVKYLESRDASSQVLRKADFSLVCDNCLRLSYQRSVKVFPASSNQEKSNITSLAATF
jgi:hypothetical protein